MLELAFYKGQKEAFPDKAICFITRGPYSHVEILLEPRSRTKETLCLSSSGRDGGVRYKNINLNSGKWDIMRVPGSTERVAAIIEAELGKPYDLRGALLSPTPFSRLINNKTKWFCSELVAYSLNLPNPATIHPNLLSKWAERSRL